MSQPVASLPDVESEAQNASIVDLLRRRITGAFETDEFGLDVELMQIFDPLVSLRWNIEVKNAGVVPAIGPAVIVANRRFGVSEPIVLGRGVRLATGRRARFLGVPDIAPVGPILRRVGGAVDRPEELHSLLRLGHVVTLSLKRSIRQRGKAGTVPAFSLEPALALGVPVIPAAVIGREVGRRWHVVLGDPIPRLSGSGPLAMAELADEARMRVQALLDEATPPHWLMG
ncbi:MAG TPA: hypothetical protein VGA13_12320 [Acidimicrobiales bacterium]|jgi:hypothetical protein